MSSFTGNDYLFSFLVHTLLVLHNGGHRFEGHIKVNVLSIGNATLYAAGIIRLRANLSAFIDKLVVVLRATQLHPLESTSVFEALNCIDTQHCFAKFGMEFIEDRFTQSHRYILNYAS